MYRVPRMSTAWRITELRFLYGQWEEIRLDHFKGAKGHHFEVLASFCQARGDPSPVLL